MSLAKKDEDEAADGAVEGDLGLGPGAATPTATVIPGAANPVVAVITPQPGMPVGPTPPGTARSAAAPSEALASSPALAATALDASGAASVPPPAMVERTAEELEADPMLGKVLSGLYKVERLLGEGGMGAVYVALHIHLKKKFAVKVLSDRIAKNKVAIERLKQEAVLASSIEHDGIVQVMNFDVTPDGSVFIVMELLKGQSLGDLVEQGAVSLERALPIVVQIARALHAAHDKGIVHRDLKPENIFITQRHGQDFAKVLDFGISKIKSAESEDVRLTKTGQLAGTPLYMSPEQAKGEKDVDRRADVYALGVVVYEMLTGTPPFEGANYFQLLWKHGNEPPQPPSEHNASIPAAIEAIILKALSKSRDERFQTMQEFEEALLLAAPWLDVPRGHTPSFSSLPPGRDSAVSLPPANGGLPWALGAVAVVAIGVAAFFGLRQPAGTHAPQVAPAADAGAVSARIDAAPEVAPTAPDASAALPEGVAAPTTVAMSIRSRPSGAAVFLGDERLGTTPMTAALPTDDLPAGGRLQLRFTFRGYMPSQHTVTPEEGGVVTVRLRRRSGGSSGLPIKQTF